MCISDEFHFSQQCFVFSLTLPPPCHHPYVRSDVYSFYHSLKEQFSFGLTLFQYVLIHLWARFTFVHLFVLFHGPLDLYLAVMRPPLLQHYQSSICVVSRQFLLIQISCYASLCALSYVYGRWEWCISQVTLFPEY